MVRGFSLPFPRGYGIRLHQTGCSSRPFYLIGAMKRSVPCRSQPQYRPDEVIGSIDPMPNERGELLVSCDLTKLCYYLGKGATPSKLLAHYLGLAGFYPMHPKVFINSWRNRQGKDTKGGIREYIHHFPREYTPGYSENNEKKQQSN